MRDFSGKSKIGEITIRSKTTHGYMASDSDGDMCFVPSKIVAQHGLGIGSVMVGALVTYSREGPFDWFAEWVLPERMVSLSEIAAARNVLESSWAVKASDIGIHVGDILYHAGAVQKIVGFNRRDPVDPSNHVAYTMCLDEVIDEMTSDEEE